MPSVAWMTPSQMSLTVKTPGLPPASKTPLLTSSTSDRKWNVPGWPWPSALSTRTCGLPRSSSVQFIPRRNASPWWLTRRSRWLRRIGRVGVVIGTGAAVQVASKIPSTVLLPAADCICVITKRSDGGRGWLPVPTVRQRAPEALVTAGGSRCRREGRGYHPARVVRPRGGGVPRVGSGRAVAGEVDGEVEVTDEPAGEVHRL